MPNTIKIKNSAVAAKVPLTTDLDYGELALNYADGKIFYKRSDNTVQSISGSGGVAGPTTIALSNKTAAYTVVAGDLGTIINCTSGTFTVSLTAAATLGAGFNCWIWNTGDGTVTIDPAGTETINGRSTIVLRSGEGTQVVCTGTDWLFGDGRKLIGYSQNISAGATVSASGSEATAIGYSAAASGAYSLALGSFSAVASGVSSIAIGSSTTASANYSSAIGSNSGASGSQAVTGGGAMALGGSYASGTDSFAVAVTDNTSTYGATAPNAITIGWRAKSTNSYAIALGAEATASGLYACAIGQGAVASGRGSFAFGSGANAVQINKFAFTGPWFTTVGDRQGGLLVIATTTVDATPTALRSNTAAASTTNQVILPNNSAFAFSGTLIARQQASTGSNYAAWEIKGALLRDATAASTVLGSHNINTLSKTAGATAWTVTLTADTTNGGLAVTVTGAAATNITWVANVQTSEVTYA